MSEVELKKRMRIEMAKRHKLKNPNVFVSTTRICCHNVPRSVNDAKLKVKLYLAYTLRRTTLMTQNAFWRIYLMCRALRKFLLQHLKMLKLTLGNKYSPLPNVIYAILLMLTSDLLCRRWLYIYEAVYFSGWLR